MRVSTNTKSFTKQMNNIIDYSFGFLDGVQKGKSVFLNNLGHGVLTALYDYIDASARSNPRAMHHIYEWMQTGSPEARLYDLSYTVSNLGLSFKSKFTQSQSVSRDSNTPFYDKARIMEQGITVKIAPVRSDVLVFDINGETVFTKKEVTVKDPGGTEVAGSFENAVDEFMLGYFKQSFIRASGLYDYINKPVLYKANVAAGSRMGRAKGVDTGFKWIAPASASIPETITELKKIAGGSLPTMTKQELKGLIWYQKYISGVGSESVSLSVLDELNGSS
jgi:hypothetical protein